MESFIVCTRYVTPHLSHVSDSSNKFDRAFSHVWLPWTATTSIVAVVTVSFCHQLLLIPQYPISIVHYHGTLRLRLRLSPLIRKK